MGSPKKDDAKDSKPQRKKVHVYSERRKKELGVPLSFPWKVHTIWECKDGKYRAVVGFLLELGQVSSTIPYTKSSMPVQSVEYDKFAKKLVRDATNDPQFEEYLKDLKKKHRFVKVEDLNPEEYEIIILD